MRTKVITLMILLIVSTCLLASTPKAVAVPNDNPKGQLNPAPFSPLTQLRQQTLISSTPVYAESFDTLPTNWTIGTGWYIGEDYNYGAHSAPFCAFSEHPYAANADYQLQSPIIAIPAITQPGEKVELSFWNWWELEFGYDYAWVDVYENGVFVSTLSSQTGASSGWQQQNFNLNAFAGQNIQLMFRLTSDYDYNYAGWGVDDIQILLNLYEQAPELNLLSLNVQNFPFVYSTLSVAMEGQDMTNLDATNFQVYENEVLQTNYFEVVPPSTGTGSRLVDIAFLMDNSGSMSSSINAVSNNVTNFINNLAGSGVDSALGLCRYGSGVNGGNPFLEDSGILTTNLTYFRDNVWARNDISGGYEPGYYAMTHSIAGFNWRPGSQKVMIIITDEYPAQGGASLQQAIDACVNNGAILFALTYSSLYSYFTPITSVTGGDVFDINSSFDAILTAISEIIVSNYIISYRSSSPTYDGVLRNLRYVLNYQGVSAETTGSYFPGQAPQITRTPDTISMDTIAQLDNQDIVIQALITDSYTPFTNSAKLYYKTLAQRNFSFINMTNLGNDLWQGIIPAAVVQTPGIGYYLSATDGQSTTTLPSVEPADNPFTIAVLPNVPPQIEHTPAAQVLFNSPLVVNANVIDNTLYVSSVNLYYRRYGQLTYTSAPMQNVSGTLYTASVPADVVGNYGVEYYIRAIDNFGLTTSSGFPDNPHYTPALLDGTIVPGGTITDYNWDSDDSPFYIYDSIVVPPGNTLIIEPGSQLIFSLDTQLDVFGGILASGVAFTAADPQLGWRGIHLESATNQIQLNNCQIQHANRALTLQNTHGSFSNITISKEFPFTDEVAVLANGASSPVFTNMFIDNYARGIVYNNENLRITSSPTLTNVRIRNTNSTIRPESRGLEVIGAVGLAINGARIENYVDGIYWDGQGTSDYRSIPTLNNIHISHDGINEPGGRTGINLVDLSSVLAQNDSIGGFNVGVQIDNTLVNRTTTNATLSGVQIRNTNSISAPTSYGLKMNGNIAATITNLETDDYQSGLHFLAENGDIRTNASATLTNVRIRNTSSTLRNDTYGIKLLGGIYANFSDVEIAEYDFGMIYIGDGQPFDRTTPTLTNVRIRNTSSTLRNASSGLTLIDLSSVIVDNDSIGGYPTGLEIQNNTDNRITTSATLTNVRIRNTSSTLRTDTFGAKLSGNIAATISNLEIDDYNSGFFFMTDSTDVRTTASATLTNVRIRNTSSTLRTETTAASLKGNINASINGLDIEDYSTGIYYEGDGQAFDRTTPTLTNVRIRNTSSTLREPIQGIVLKNLAAVNLLKNIIYPNVTDLRGNAEGSGIILDNTHNAVVQQNTVWGITNGLNAINSNNVDFSSNVIWTNGAELANPIINTGSALTVSNSDISYDNGIFPGAGNLDKNPLFASPKAGNFYLKIRSPLKGSGIGALPFDFTALAANRTYSMHRGWNLMGVPYTTLPPQNTPVAIFADDINPFYVAPNYTSIVQLNSNAMPDSLGHVTFNYSGSYNIPSVVRPAVGYWVNNPSPQDVPVYVCGLMDDGSYNLELPGSPLPNNGWYLVSNPYDRPIRFSDSTLVPSGAMLPWGYIYRRATNSYVMVDADPANDNDFNTTDIPPWSAFFVKAYSPADLLFINYPADDRHAPAQDLVASSNFGSSQVPKPEWEFTLNAVTTGHADAVTLGISNASSEGYDPMDVPELPSAPVVLNRGLDFCIANNDWEINPGTYTRDIRNKETNSWSWPLLLNLETLLENGRFAESIRISPEFADKLPATHSFMLQNPATGQSIDLKTQSLLLSVNIDTSNPAGGTTPWLIPLSLVVSPVDGGQPQDQRGIISTANYPNPFNPETTISYALGSDAAVNLEIYNVKGQLVNRLLNTNQTKGSHSVVWNGKDSQGHNVASGFYFYRLQAGETSQTRKILLMK